MTRSGVAIGIVGGLGAGWTFATSTPLMLDFLGLGILPRHAGTMRWVDFVPVVFIVGAALTAMLAGRFGWVVAGGGAVAAYALYEIRGTGHTVATASALFGARSLAQGIVLGGALAAFVAADRGGRAIAPALAAGTVGGFYLTVTWAANATHLWRPVLHVLVHTPQALSVAAGIGSLVLLLRRADTGAGATRRDWVLPAVSVVAASAAIVFVGLAAHNASTGLYAAAAAVVVIAIVAAWRAGPLAAAFALAGFAAGSATAIDELVSERNHNPGPFAAAAVGGVVLGTLLGRFVSAVPWEAVALVGAAAALLASHSPSLRELGEHRIPYPTGPVTAVALVGLATAAMLLRVGDHLPDARTCGVAGFASFVVGGVLAAPVSGFVRFENPLWDRWAIAIALGVAGLAVLALHLVSVTRRGASART